MTGRPRTDTSGCGGSGRKGRRTRTGGTGLTRDSGGPVGRGSDVDDEGRGGVAESPRRVAATSTSVVRAFSRVL